MYMEANLLISPYIVLVIPWIAKEAMDRDDGPLDLTLLDMLPASAEGIVVDQGQGLASARRVADLEEIDLSILDGGQVSTDDIALVLLSGGKRGVQESKWESDRKGGRSHVDNEMVKDNVSGRMYNQKQGGVRPNNKELSFRS
jgi:hypothetical protein